MTANTVVSVGRAGGKVGVRVAKSGYGVSLCPTSHPPKGKKTPTHHAFVPTTKTRTKKITDDTRKNKKQKNKTKETGKAASSGL